ncbi:MAG: flagellar hook-basal body complex protein [Gemmatimonadaceae bacterium]|nr:flagellar hook-basal body complex protein [Acetobacteraceae bacterium]
MNVPSSIALSRLMAQTRALEVTAMNLANANTPGFKAGRVMFSDWLSRQTGADAPRGGRVLAFVQDRATYRDQQAGPVQQTGNPFDLAVSGDGYFSVETARGPRLTRAGRFTPMADGRLGDADGQALLDTAGAPIRIAAADQTIVVAANGTISSQNGPLGRIGIVRPADPMRMAAEGGRTLRADTDTAPVDQPQILQGAIEDSNVQPVIEVTRMMAELREFQFTTQFVQGEADRLQSAIDKLTQRKG